MKNNFQSTEWVEKRSKELFKINPRRSPSPVFRNFRKNASVSLIGDYTIIWQIVDVATKLGIKWSKAVFWGLCKQSKEYQLFSKRDKMLWIKEFSELNK